MLHSRMAKIPTRSTFDDLSGKRFNRLLVVSYEGQIGGSAGWRVRCDCGTEKVVKRKNLLSGKQQSCGCLLGEQHPMMTHGMYGTPEYRAWNAMKGRCHNPKNKRYPYYGGRGISVCAEWASSFESFFRDMGFRPSTKHSLDRIDTDGNYEPENCRWADKLTQGRNKRSVMSLTVDGVTKTISEWAAERGIKPSTLSDRVKRLGWDAERALGVDPSAYRSRRSASS